MRSSVQVALTAVVTAAVCFAIGATNGHARPSTGIVVIKPWGMVDFANWHFGCIYQVSAKASDTGVFCSDKRNLSGPAMFATKTKLELMRVSDNKWVPVASINR
jgi:hypothetical protein